MTLSRIIFFKKIFILFILSIGLIAWQFLAEAADLSSLDTTAAVKKVEPLEGGMEGTISLDLRNIDVVDALKFLAMKAGINIVTTKSVTGRVTLMVENVTVKDIFDIMLRSNELAYVKQGNIYNVMTEAEYKSLYGKKFADVRQVRTFRLKYAIPEQAFTLLDTLKSDVGRVLVEPDSGTVLIMDTPEAIANIERALSTMEEKNRVEVFDLQYAHAKDVEQQLKSQLDAKKVGSIKADERSNQVVVQALPDRMEDIEKLIDALDRKTREVLIDARIIKIRLSDAFSQGIEWEGIMKIGQRYGMTYFGSTPFSVIQAATDAWRDRRQVLHDLRGRVGSYPQTGFTSDYTEGQLVSPGEAMHLGIINRLRDVDVLVKFLNTIGNTQILSNPKIAVLNNQEARIHVGERQAYVTTTTTTGQTTTTVSEEVTFVDVGIQLAVTPTINEEGYIRMKIKPEISSVTSTLVTPTGNKIPIIDTSTAETTVMVKDGSTIVIGGLRREEETKTSEEFPYLGKIPILGFLFRSRTEEKIITELLLLLTPHIIEGDVLVTGDRSEYEYETVKEYKDYTPLRDESPLGEKGELWAESGEYEKNINARLKPYKIYTHEETKGEIADE